MRTAFGGLLAGHHRYWSVETHGVAGQYLPPPCVTTGNITATNGTVYYTFIPVHIGVPLLRLGVNLVTAGADAGAVARLGIFRNTTAGVPGDLVLDAGQAPVGSGITPGTIEIATGGPFLDTGNYWCACLVTGVSTTAPVFTGVVNAAIPELGTATIDGNLYIAWTLPAQTVFVPNPTGLVRVTSMLATMPKVGNG